MGQTWRIDGARNAVEGGAESLVAEADGLGRVELGLRLSDREREMLLAGGLLAFVRSGGLEPVVPLTNDDEL